MVSYRFVAMAGMAGMVAALPLNINLGAYSPALVVGQFFPALSRGLRANRPLTRITVLLNTLWGNR
ncbi:hypothetical protein MAPG_11865 [Magnaporthiopsis poae ATCC 64411]|uniref:Uncharacterized protein n=1 Tax=Magnaporthiopsis poae (strain ATCC 64411 / 73-15) TaxID=644358 RepID=A0A0C4EGD0_MAGP6|nr:hypothetical protein MAPG_11865 [Magnaporthiopsis poae ATCC 64411]